MQTAEIRIYTVCHTCRVKHRLPKDYPAAQIDHVEFRQRHKGHRVKLHKKVFQGYADNANVKEAFGTNNQSITCTITSLTNNSQRGSTAIDNTSNLYLDVLVFGKIKSGASATSATGTFNIYAYGTADGGTTYSDGVSGTDGAATLTSPPNVPLIGQINMVANSTTYSGGPFGVAKGFDFILPDHWGLVGENKTGGTIDASVGSLWYQGVYNTVV